MPSKPLNWTAIILGWAAHVFCGGVFGAIISAILLPMMTVSRPSGTDLQQISVAWMIISFAVNAVISIFVGYLAGRIAGNSEVKHALIVAALSFVTSMLFMSRILLQMSLPQIALQIALALPIFLFAALGGFLAQAKRKPAIEDTQSQQFDTIPRI